MNFNTVKFYDALADGSGGSADVVKQDVVNDAPIAEPEVQIDDATKDEVKAEIPKQIISDDELKSYGFDSGESLKIFLAKQKELNISDEEKDKKANIEKADFIKFSAENDLLKVEDYNQYETIKSKTDIELVRQRDFEEFKADHSDITDEEELKEAFEEDFNYEYKLNEGISEAAKKKGAAKLAREAKEIRSPFESKITEAQSKYNENKQIKETYPKFEKFITESITRNTPDKMVVFKTKDGDDEIEIDIELTQADREAMAKSFKTPKTFHQFTTAKPEEIQAILDNKMNGWLKLNKFNDINEKVFEHAKGLGVKKGSNVGSENPYPLTANSSASVAQDETLEASNIRIAALRRKQQLR